MYSFSSASHTCEPLPRTINGGSAPTDLNARTGEFTPPGIMLSARCCRRRDCSVWRKVVEGINSSRPGENRCQSNWDVSVYYSSGRIHQIFTNLQSVCNISAVPWGHQVTLLTGRVLKDSLGGSGLSFLLGERRTHSSACTMEGRPPRRSAAFLRAQPSAVSHQTLTTINPV